MYQLHNNLALIYDFNGKDSPEYIVEMNFNLSERKLTVKCNCEKEKNCVHCDYMVDFIYNSYFHLVELRPENVRFQGYNNKLWLPVCDYDFNENPFLVDVELLYTCNKFHYYCSYCSPGVDELESCRHLDFIIHKFSVHYYEMKEQDDEIDNLDFNINLNNEQNNEHEQQNNMIID